LRGAGGGAAAAAAAARKARRFMAAILRRRAGTLFPGAGQNRPARAGGALCVARGEPCAGLPVYRAVPAEGEEKPAAMACACG
jgi:hypothetical protein